MGRNQAIDCNPEKYRRKQAGHRGDLANDPIDDLMTNLKYEVASKPNSSVYEDFVYVYIAESAWDDISNNDELFIAYGKQYWLYRPFWNSLSEANQREAAKLYNFDPEEELIDPVWAIVKLMYYLI